MATAMVRREEEENKKKTSTKNISPLAKNTVSSESDGRFK